MRAKKGRDIVKKLYEELPIELWIDLASKITRMNFSEKSEEEFYNNLKQLVKKLFDTEFDLTTGSRNITSKEEIGLSSLLYEIYQMEIIDTDSNGIMFYKKMKELLNLGIKTVEFLPVEFPSEITLERTTEEGKIKFLSKSFTDGEFEFCRFGKENQNIRIGNLRDANYILKLDMKRNREDKLVVVDGKATIRTFNGYFPTKEEMKSEELPKIDEAPTKYFFDIKHPLSKQIFKSK